MNSQVQIVNFNPHSLFIDLRLKDNLGQFINFSDYSFDNLGNLIIMDFPLLSMSDSTGGRAVINYGSNRIRLEGNFKYKEFMTSKIYLKFLDLCEYYQLCR